MWSSLGNEALPPHVRWVSEPNGRGTYGIFSSCLITLTLCIWSCLHLNVPENREHLAKPHTERHRMLTKIRWVIIGMLAPEVIAFSAAAQWSTQHKLGVQMRRILRTQLPKEQPSRMLRFFRVVKAEKEEPSLSKKHRLYAWTATHSYLVIMGGFAFDNSHDPDGCPFPDDRRRLTALADGILALAYMEPDLVPDLSVDAIRDKSKTNSMAKLLACIQALWFCLQMVARMAQHLPLTLLELVTFAHAICALAVYILWWNKPLDIEEPFLIPVPRDSRSAALCRAMILTSGVGRQILCYTREPNARERARVDAEAGTKLVVDGVQLWPCYNKGAVQIKADLWYNPEGLLQYVFDRPTELRVLSPDILATRDCRSREDPSQDDGGGEGLPASQESGAGAVSLPPHSATVLKMREAFDFVECHGWSLTDMKYFLFALPIKKREFNVVLDSTFWGQFNSLAALARRPEPLLQRNELKSMLETRLKHLSFCANNMSGDTPNSLLVLWIIGSLLYSGWHLTAWEGPFRTFTTELLWRIASIGPGALMTLILAYILLSTTLGIEKLSDIVGYYLILTVVLTVTCRMYLVVESFIGLGYISDAGFQQPDWSPYFPHVP